MRMKTVIKSANWVIILYAKPSACIWSLFTRMRRISSSCWRSLRSSVDCLPRYDVDEEHLITCVKVEHSLLCTEIESPKKRLL
jgi:hypothetical protein